eukprot:scaffold1034_cov127-Cylindrotheca_fusiformis.AAC.23
MEQNTKEGRRQCCISPTTQCMQSLCVNKRSRSCPVSPLFNRVPYHVLTLELYMQRLGPSLCECELESLKNVTA